MATNTIKHFQSLLRGRFLRNERPVEEERPPSMAAGELVQLRQRHTVSGLRYVMFLVMPYVLRCLNFFITSLFVNIGIFFIYSFVQTFSSSLIF